MPITWSIDAQRRIIVAVARGVLRTEDLFAYQIEIRGDPKLADHGELVDMRHVDRIAFESHDKARDLATLATRSDRTDAPPMRMAIVATDDFAFGLGRMYAGLRSAEPGSNARVRVFRDYDEALSWVSGTTS